MPFETSTISIPERFCGPVTSANGGYASGLIAQFIEGAASVTLKAPPPLDVPLTIEHLDPGKSVRLMYGEMEIAAAISTSLDVKTPPIPKPDAVMAARKSYLDAAPDHPLPGCFVCGPERSEGDGLRIFAGPTPDSPVNADIWQPDQTLADDDGKIREEFLWAAMDCPTAWATRVSLSDTLILLGQMSAHIQRKPDAGEKLTVLAWPTKTDGRKHYAQSALIDESGQTIATADALWIEITDPKFLQFLKTGK